MTVAAFHTLLLMSIARRLGFTMEELADLTEKSKTWEDPTDVTDRKYK